MSRRLAGLVSTGLLAMNGQGCRAPDEARTELVVLIDTDLALPDPVDHFEVTVDGPAGFHLDRTADLTALDAPRLPLILSLEHGDGALQPLTVTVTATGHDLTLSQTAVTPFEPGASHLLPFVLTDACVGARCDAGTTCTSRSRCDPTALDVTALPASSTVTHLAAGASIACARTIDGRVKCWGRSAVDGNGANPLQVATATPTVVAGVHDAVDVATGDGHACAIRLDGSVVCWGDNRSGMVGAAGADMLQAAAVAVPDLGGVVQLALGRGFSCARSGTGEVSCWGSDAVGQLGDGGGHDTATPVAVALPEPVAQITAGSLFACARGRSGAVYCWGFGSHGQLGNGAAVGTVDVSVPVAVQGLDDAVDVSAGVDYVCARRGAGSAVACWGSNAAGQLGDGTQDSRSVVAPVMTSAHAPLTGTTGLATGNNTACATMRGGGVMCWGANGSGQLGNNTLGGSAQLSPVAVLASIAHPYADALRVVGTGYYFCLLDRTREVLCWGLDQDRQLGTTSNDPAVPMPRVVEALP